MIHHTSGRQEVACRRVTAPIADFVAREETASEAGVDNRGSSVYYAPVRTSNARECRHTVIFVVEQTCPLNYPHVMYHPRPSPFSVCPALAQLTRAIKRHT